jgi:hypothetical protein
VQADLQGGVAAHRQADDVRLVDLEMIEHRDRVVAEIFIAVDVRGSRHVRRRIAARGIDDAAMLAREMPHLRLPAAVVAGEFVHEQNRRAAAGFLVIEAHAVFRQGMGHCGAPA